MTTYPLSHGDISPGPEFTKMPATVRADGLPDGVHTGGCWKSTNPSMVWKPLDCRPYPNATERSPTLEAQCLAEMSYTPGFLPKGEWRIEERDGRRWLVLPKMWFWPQDRDLLLTPTMYDLLTIEHAMMALNKAGWMYNDAPQLAYHKNVPVLVDFSAAAKPKKWTHGHNDEFRMDRWWKDMGRPDISELRARGRHVRHAIRCPDFCDKAAEPFDVVDRFDAFKVSADDRQEYQHIYASLNRPMSALWARIPGTVFLQAAPQQKVWTWVASNHPLDTEIIRRYELTYAWSPWA